LDRSQDSLSGVRKNGNTQKKVKKLKTTQLSESPEKTGVQVGHSPSNEQQFREEMPSRICEDLTCRTRGQGSRRGSGWISFTSQCLTTKAGLIPS